MKDFVSSRRVSILVWTAALWIFGLILALPGEGPWTDGVGALALLLVSSSAFLSGAAAPRSPAPAVPRAAHQNGWRKP
jgi:hypothetical protein